MKNARVVCVFVCAMLCLFGISAFVSAQGDVAAVTGRVFDPNAAIIIEAIVTARNVDTGVKVSVLTNVDGIYRFANLSPGNYEFTVSKRGFKAIVKPGVTLHLADTISMNFNMVVGAVTETVTVEAGASMLNTTDATVGTLVDQSYIKNMPLNGRSFQDLILLTPGIVTQSSQSGATFTTALGATGEFSVNGQRPESNYYMVDGVSGNLGAASGASMINGGGPSGSVPAATALGTTQALVSVDDLQEFRVQSSTYSAEYGRNPGAQLAFETKSGTNQWHGSASEYLRNDALDATDFFTNYQRAANATLTKPALRQNDFGATFGGPVRIPGAYNGKDKTFFFVSYEGLRLRQPQPAVSQPVPDADLRTSTAAPLDQVLNAFPVQTPGAPDDQANFVGRFVGNWSNPASLDSTSVRFDHAIKDKTRLFFRFSNTTSDSTLRGAFGLPATMKSTTAYTTRTYTGGATVVPTSRFSNDFRLNYSSNETTGAQSIDQFGGSQPVDLAKLTGLGPLSNVVLGFALGSDFLILNQSQDAGKQRQWNLVDTASYSVGRHQFKFGVDYRRLTPFAVPNTATAEYIYFDASTVQSNSPDFYAAGLSAAAYPLYTNFSFFGQDEWRVSPRLSLSMGLRWEVNPAPGVTQGLMPYAVRGSTPDTYAVAPQGTPLWNTTWYNFAPRLGAAYILRDRQGWETVIRGGGGLFFDTAQQAGSNGFNGPGFNSFAGAFPAPPFPQVPPIAPIVDPTTPAGQPYGAEPNAYSSHLQLPYTLQWNASIEQALGKSQTLTLSYVGSHAGRLLRSDQIATPNNANSSFFEFTVNGLTSDYQSAQVQFQRRLTRGLTALASYTWSHCLDYGSQNYNFGYQRGDCDFDVRHNFSAAFSYDVPNVGHNRFVNGLLHHWGLDDRFTARTAFPITLDGDSYTEPQTGRQLHGGLNWDPTLPLYLYGDACTQVFLASFVGGQTCPGGRAINPKAFAPTTSAGNAPRNFVRGFGAWQMNLAVRREFPIYERMALQFRAEAFNVFNHTNFGAITPIYCSPDPNDPNNNFSPGCTFGLATATLANSLGNTLDSLYQTGGPRSMQVSLKLVF